MALDKTPIKKVLSYLAKVDGAIEQEAQRNFLQKAIDAGTNALDAMADNEEKYAYLYFATLNWANQASIFLLQANKFTKELEEEYRSFPLPETAEANYKEFKNARQAEVDRINAEQKEVMDKQRGFEIFQAIVGGMSKEEAKAKMEEYEKQIAAAQAQTARR